MLYHDLFGDLIQVDGLVAAGAAADDLSTFRRAGHWWDRGANLRGDGSEDGKPVL